MGLYFLDYGAGNVQSLANSLTKLGHSFEWIKSAEDFDKATVWHSSYAVHQMTIVFMSSLYRASSSLA